MRKEQESDINEVINVVFATDAYYIIPTYIAAFSVMQNHKNKQKIIINVLPSGDCTQEDYLLMNRLLDRFSNCEIRFIDVGDSYSDVEINQMHITTPTMYRLLLPEVLKEVDKCGLSSFIVGKPTIAH